MATQNSPAAGRRAPVRVILDATDPALAPNELVEAVRTSLRRGDQLTVLTDATWLLGADGDRTPADAAEGGVVVLLDGHAAVSGRHWLDDVVALATDGDAGTGAGAAVGVPRSNGAPWPQCPADAPDVDADRSTLRTFAQRVREQRVDVAPLDRLAGPCVAIPPGLLRRLGPVTPTVAALRRALERLDEPVAIRVAPRAYVHARAGVPQVSVCLIMKDEEQDLPGCIESLRPLADEIVIFDTGSTDGSVALARSLGATVLEGGWRQDFAWARNQALQAARGTWVLSIDPDEQLEIEPEVVPEVRGLLGDDPPVDRFIIDLFDLQGSVHAPVRSGAGVPMARLFRRTRCHWVGALHEQPDVRPGLPPARSVALPGVQFLHHGYLDEIIREKGKWARNLSVATAGLDKVPDSAKECFDLGRSLRSVGEHARAFTLFERAAELDEHVVITRAALEFAVLTLAETGRSDLCDPYLDRLAALDGGAGPARYLRGWCNVHQGRWQEALDQLDGVTGYDDNFTGFRAESLTLGLAIAYRGLGRLEEAAEAAVRTIERNDQALDAWAVLLDATEPGSDAERTAAAAVPAEHRMPLFAALQRFPAERRDRLADAMWEANPGDRVVLAVASQLAPLLAVPRQVRWSARLRAAGLASLCPLRALADDGTRTVADRAAALAAGVGELGAADLEEALERLANLLLDDELVALLERCLAEGSPAAGTVIVGGATTAARCVAMVASLHAAGFVAEALAVLAHGGELDPVETRRLLARTPELDAALRSAARTAGRDDLDAVLPDAA